MNADERHKREKGYRQKEGYRVAHLRASKKWQREHPDKYKALKHAYYLKHAERIKAYHRQWVRDHPERVKAYTARRKEALCAPAPEKVG